MQKLKLTKTLEIKFKTNLTNLSIGIDSPETILFSPISPFSLFVAICSCLPPSVEFGSAEVRKNQVFTMDMWSCMLWLTKMDVLSCILWLLFTRVFVMALSTFSRGRKQPLPLGSHLIRWLENSWNWVKNLKSIGKLAKIHGPISTLKFGEVNTVVVSSATMTKCILKDHDSSFYNWIGKDAIFPCQHHEFEIVILPVSTT